MFLIAILYLNYFYYMLYCFLFILMLLYYYILTGDKIMYKETFDFYDRTSLKSYNLDQTMRYQLNMLDRLDVFTRKHCENVGDLTCRLCEHLHCSKGFTEYCTICGYLHDIGKQFIPSEILQKPGKLTDEEYEIMKTHTTIGYNMCMKDSKLQPYAVGPYCHHEALDGSRISKRIN